MKCACKFMHGSSILSLEITMATLQVRDIDDRLYKYLKTSAKLKNRSISQEVITIIKSTSITHKTLLGMQQKNSWHYLEHGKMRDRLKK